MKLLPYIAAAVIATASFSALAAQEVSKKQASELQSLGVVSAYNVSGSPDDAISVINQKATAEGASHFRIIGLDNPGDSSNWRASAEIYR